MFEKLFHVHSKHSRDIARLYQSWSKTHLRRHCLQLSWISAAILVLLMALDYVLFPQAVAENMAVMKALAFTVILMLLGSIALAERWLKHWTSIEQGLSQLWVATATFACTSFVLLYSFHLAAIHPKQVAALFPFLMMAFVYPIVATYRFWRLQLQVVRVASLCAGILLLSLPPLRAMLLVLIGNMIAVSLMSFYFRRVFSYSLWQRYQQSATVLPPNLAFSMHLMEKKEDLDIDFNMLSRQVALLMGRWHSDAQSADLAAWLRVLEVLLDEEIPAGNYFLDWNAQGFTVMLLVDAQSGTQPLLRVADKLCAQVQSFYLNLALTIGTAEAGVFGSERRRKTLVRGTLLDRAERYCWEAAHFRQKIHLPATCLVLDIAMEDHQFGLKLPLRVLPLTFASAPLATSALAYQSHGQQISDLGYERTGLPEPWSADL